MESLSSLPKCKKSFTRKCTIFKRLHVLTVYCQYVYNLLLRINLRMLSRSQKCFPVAAMKFFNSLPEKMNESNQIKCQNPIHISLINRPTYSLDERHMEPLFSWCQYGKVFWRIHKFFDAFYLKLQSFMQTSSKMNKIKYSDMKIKFLSCTTSLMKLDSTGMIWRGLESR